MEAEIDSILAWSAGLVRSMWESGRLTESVADAWPGWQAQHLFGELGAWSARSAAAQAPFAEEEMLYQQEEQHRRQGQHHRAGHQHRPAGGVELLQLAQA